jgi:uncharacterized protein YacL
MAVRRERTRPAAVFVELVRLAVVVLATAGTYELTARSPLGQPVRDFGDTMVLLAICLGAAVGYVAGGMFGRFALGRVDAAERQLRNVSSGELVAGAIGGLIGLLFGAALTWPLLLFGAEVYTLPLAVVLVVIAVTIGVRVGASRGGDLMRLIGVSGRVAVTTPSSGPRARIVDTSALVDGRLLHVARGGFLDGALVIPRFVLYELQGLADAADDERRMRGQRGFDVLAALQRASGISVEVTEHDRPDLDDVDAKLVALALEHKASLITVDGNLGRVAEIQGVKVLNLHQLAEDLRPPVLPGDLLKVRIVKAGKEAGQGVGYLSDGTMVVVEGGRDHRGEEVAAEVTSILSNPNGRMVFATRREPAARGVRRAGGPRRSGVPAGARVRSAAPE